MQPCLSPPPNEGMMQWSFAIELLSCLQASLHSPEGCWAVPFAAPDGVEAADSEPPVMAAEGGLRQGSMHVWSTNVRATCPGALAEGIAV